MLKKIYRNHLVKYFYLLRILLLVCSFVIVSCGDDGGNGPLPDDTVKPFANVPATEDIVMYEVNIRTFSGSGDFNGITNKLDHIKSLGTNVIWLMPVNPIGQLKSVNSPYCVKDYKAVNPEFGDLDDFKNLVNEAHKKDMAVIIDWAANHTAWDNAWIQNKDWYTQNAAGEIIIPPGTNWEDVADLNYDNAEMRLAMIDAMKYWITGSNIDGFRCDAADYIPFSFWTQAIDSLKKLPERNLILLAEGGRSDHFTAGFQMNYAWDFYNKLKDVYLNKFVAYTLFSTNTQEYRNVPAGSHKLRFITNHDESAWEATPVEMFGGVKSSFSTFVITAYLGGVPLVYSSQEVGVKNKVSFFSKNAIDWSQNPELLSSYKQVLSFYRESDALRKGTVESYQDVDILSFKKIYGTEEVLVMVNVRSKSISYALPAVIQNTNWNNAFDGADLQLNSTLDFEPFQYYVLKK